MIVFWTAGLLIIVVACGIAARAINNHFNWLLTGIESYYE